MVDAQSTPRQMVKLLSALVVLMAVLLVGFAASVIYLFSEYREIRQSLALNREPAPGGPRLANLIGERQAEVSAELLELSRRSERRADALEAKVKDLHELAKKEKGPIDTAKQMVTLANLFADEAVALMHQVARTQEVIAKGVRPLGDPGPATEPPQRGTGGSGTKQ
jgi:hypothetical protein